MYKIIGTDGKEYGPVSADQLRRWISEGRVNGQTRVQTEGSAEWRLIEALPEFAASMPDTPEAAPPLFRNPVAASAPEESFPAGERDFLLGDCFRRSWSLLMSNFGLLAGATFLVWLTESVLMFIPVVGIVVLLLHGVLFGGLYRVFLSCIRGQSARMGDAFSGFSMGFPQLMLAGLVTTFLSLLAGVCCLVLPGLYLGIAWVFSIPLVADRQMEFWTAMEASRKIATRIWFKVFALVVIGYLPMLLFNCYAGVKRSLLLIATLQSAQTGPPDFQHLMATLGPVLGTSFLLDVLARVVLLISLPLLVGAIAYAYEDLFGARTARAA